MNRDQSRHLEGEHKVFVAETERRHGLKIEKQRTTPSSSNNQTLSRGGRNRGKSAYCLGEYLGISHTCRHVHPPASNPIQHVRLRLEIEHDYGAWSGGREVLHPHLLTKTATASANPEVSGTEKYRWNEVKERISRTHIRRKSREGLITPMSLGRRGA